MFVFKLKTSVINGLLIYGLSIGLIWIYAGCNSQKSNKAETAGHDPKQLALTYLANNQLEEATAAFAKAIQVNPDDSSNYMMLSRLYLLQKNYDAAEEQAKNGLKIDPDNEKLMLILSDIYDKRNEPEKAEKVLLKLLDTNPEAVKAYYKLATLTSSNTSRKYYLLKVLSLAPANIIPRLQLATLLAGENKADSSLFYLQSVKKITPGFSDAIKQYYQKAAAMLQANAPAKGLPYLQQFHQLLKITPGYVSAREKIAAPEMLAGHFQFDTNLRNLVLDTSLLSDQVDQGSVLSNMKFTDVSASTGMSLQKISQAAGAVLAVTDYNTEGSMYFYAGFTASDGSCQCDLLTNKLGTFKETKVRGGLDHQARDLDAAFADYDNDGYQDLFIATTGGILAYKNSGDGTFSRINHIGINDAGPARKLLFADLDQDGDLDLYTGGKNGNKFFRNNGDGTFTQDPAVIGLTAVSSLDMDFGDWDQDGDLDIISVDDDGHLSLFNNNRHANFNHISEPAGFHYREYKGTVVGYGDYNNDGRLDILTAGGPGQKFVLLRNDPGSGAVMDDQASQQISQVIKGIKVKDAAFLDFDNDGRQDILIAGINEDRNKPGIKLFHNDGEKGFSDVSHLLPDTALQAYSMGMADFNYDGDEDIFLGGPGGGHLLRNDGGNRNNYIQIHLTGLSFGNSKNNRLGIGAQVEVKSMDLYQLKTVKDPLTEFGLGPRRKIDAIRVIWPNGVPQSVADPTRKQRILEKELLKGSCPYLFTWNGKKYEFLKDMMWRSALGMPLSINGTDTTYAYAGPSKEYLLIPGEKLKSKNGQYSIKITEELWEAIFFDKITLSAVDHLDSVNIYTNERMAPPPYPGRKLYLTSKEHLPVTATDGKGNNLLPKISAYDFQYVSNFPIGKYQGLAKKHDLILDLGNKADTDSLLLFLRGWVFPTDASINMQLTQTDKYKPQPPYLQVINKEGKWQTVIKNIGYPLGRDKMVIVDLSGKFLTDHDRRVRVCTNMQIYWDHIFFSSEKVKAPFKIHELKMENARLSYHGYSASYRKGGPFGPFWVNYNKVTNGQKWRDLTGYYTRYGDVLPLLQQADDEYIIANSGDEVTIDFDATNLPPLPAGWKRDFIIYSEGWVKDGDLNTAHGQTVAPLPFHNMPSYPYGKNYAYPTDKKHREYQKKYNTRKVTTDDFKNALRLGSFEKQVKSEMKK